MASDCTNSEALGAIVKQLTGLEFVNPPQAPGATIALALIPDPRDGTMMTVSGCDRSADLALAACAGEASEFVAQIRQVNTGAMGDPQVGRERFLMDWLSPAEPCEDWLPATVLLTGAEAEVPAPYCHYDAASAQYDISTGCAAGATYERACHHALCEIIERHTSARWKAGNCNPKAVDIEGDVASWLRLARRTQTGRETRLLQIGTDAVMPVIASVSFDFDGRDFASGVCAHPDPACAAIGAVREMIQMEFGLLLARYKRDRIGEQHLLVPDLEHLENAGSIGSNSSLVTADTGSPLPSPGDWPKVDASTADIASILTAKGHKILVTVLSDVPGLLVVKVFVTGMPPPIRHVT